MQQSQNLQNKKNHIEAVTIYITKTITMYKSNNLRKNKEITMQQSQSQCIKVTNYITTKKNHNVAKSQFI